MTHIDVIIHDSGARPFSVTFRRPEGLPPFISLSLGERATLLLTSRERLLELREVIGKALLDNPDPAQESPKCAECGLEMARFAGPHGHGFTCVTPGCEDSDEFEESAILKLDMGEPVGAELSNVR